MKVKEKILYSLLITLSFVVLILFGVFHVAGNKRNYKNQKDRSDNISLNAYTKKPDKGDSIKNFANSLLGIPYKYAQSSPEGFDCSGFVFYVFSHFNIHLSRSSYTMAEEGIEVDSFETRPGDLIFFKGTNIADPKVGHVGIVVSEIQNPIEFIHASSGKKKNGVVKTKLSDSNYSQRYLMIRRYY